MGKIFKHWSNDNSTIEMFKVLLYFLSWFTGITIGLERTLVEVNENDGFVELCARVLSGNLMRDVLVMVVYEDRYAVGKFATYKFSKIAPLLTISLVPVWAKNVI